MFTFIQKIFFKNKSKFTFTINQKKKIKEMVDSNYSSDDITRLCMLFSARFAESEAAKLKAILRQQGLDVIARVYDRNFYFFLKECKI